MLFQVIKFRSIDKLIAAFLSLFLLISCSGEGSNNINTRENDGFTDNRSSIQTIDEEGNTTTTVDEEGNTTVVKTDADGNVNEFQCGKGSVVIVDDQNVCPES